MPEPAEGETKARPMRLQAFRHAIDGLRVLVTTQPNARFHLIATIGVAGAGVFFHLTAIEWAMLTIAIALVWIVEGLNTAIEFLVDIVSPEKQKLAGWAKDVAAGAVLLASICAVIVGALIFGRHL